MRKITEKKPNYNRKAAHLSSRKSEKKVTKIYMDSRKYENRQQYNDYYDDFSQERKKPSIAGIITIVAAMAVVFALVIVGLSLLKPKDEETGLVKADEASYDVNTETSAETAEDVAADTVAEADTGKPVIYGVIPLATYAGHTISYKSGVYVTDDTDPAPTLEIDNEDVNLSVPGTYTVTYIARDKYNNESTESTTVTVLEGENIISEDEINAFADSVLDALITDDMTDAEKCLAVYEYLHAIGYVDEVHSEDWMQNAYWMMKRREGDCFCYYSAARLLLTRLGYDVMEVRNNNNYVHYWCLVSIDGGNTWWHFDACCWSWGEDGVLCLVSDNYLTEFTKRHMTSDGRLIHAWDRTKYPATPADDFWTDEDRSVIYENGLIELDPEYDENDDIWNTSDGWDEYYNRMQTDYYSADYGTEYYDGAPSYDNTGVYDGTDYTYQEPADVPAQSDYQDPAPDAGADTAPADIPYDYGGTGDAGDANEWIINESEEIF